MAKKENSGAKGTGFSGKGKSNSYAKLPGSSNAELGISGDFVAGSAVRPANAPSKARSNNNVGAGGGQSSESANNYGSGAHKQGSVGSRENMTIGPKENRGDWARAAGNGKLPEVGSSIYGPGARAEGTASTTSSDTPGRGGSMALAFAGLNGGGKSASPTGKPIKGKVNKDVRISQKAINRRGSGDE